MDDLFEVFSQTCAYSGLRRTKHELIHFFSFFGSDVDSFVHVVFRSGRIILKQIIPPTPGAINVDEKRGH